MSTRWLQISIALLAAALAPYPALAQTSSATPAAPIQGNLAGGSDAGTLAGGGEIDYQVPLPGDSLTASINLQYDPPDNSGQVGFSLFGSQGEIPGVAQCIGQNSQALNNIVVTPIGASAPVTVLAAGTGYCSSPQTLLSAQVTQVGPETYTMKLYNRKPGVAIHYSVSVTGIPLPCQPTTAPGGPAPAQASPLGAPVTSQLNGGGQGQFAYYRFHYNGDNSTVMVVLFYNPVTPQTRLGAFGFNIYLGPTLIRQAQTTPSDGQLVAGFNSTTPGDYYVQVFNYTQPASLTNYTLSQSGLPCPAAPASAPGVANPAASPATASVRPATPAGTTSDTAIPFPGSDSRSLTGSSAGAYAWYRIDYDGHSNPNLTMSYSPADASTANGIGFNLYGPNQISIAASQTTVGNLTLVMPSYPQPAPFYVQVFNYIPGNTITFTLQRGGAITYS